MQGRFGNNIFQYVFGYLLAKKWNYSLSCPPIPEFSFLPFNINGNTYKDLIEIKEGNDYDTITTYDQLEQYKNKNGILLNGYFQMFNLYKDNISEIKSLFDPLFPIIPNIKIDDNDIVLHIRREDYVYSNYQLNINYYTKILDENNFKKIYVVGVGINDAIVKNSLAKYNPIYINASSFDSFKFIMCFKNVIMSNSTFCWWAAFLSKSATKIYFPIPIKGLWSKTRHLEYPFKVNLIDLTIPNDNRYIYVENVPVGD